jgi:hypothetical protein
MKKLKILKNIAFFFLPMLLVIGLVILVISFIKYLYENFSFSYDNLVELSPVFNLSATFCLLIVTLIYTIVTYKQFRETKRQQLIDNYPNLKFYVKDFNTETQNLDLSITNCGKIPIINLTIKSKFLYKETGRSDYKYEPARTATDNSTEFMNSLEKIEKRINLYSELDLNKIEPKYIFLQIYCSFEDMSNNLYYHTTNYNLAHIGNDNKGLIILKSEIIKKKSFDKRNDAYDLSIENFWITKKKNGEIIFQRNTKSSNYINLME